MALGVAGFHRSVAALQRLIRWMHLSDPLWVGVGAPDVPVALGDTIPVLLKIMGIGLAHDPIHG